MSSKAKYKVLEEILNEVKILIDSPDTDLGWSRYNTVEEFLQVIDSYLDKVKREDESVIMDLRVFFASTGSLQEVAISSGWGWRFIGLSSRFDDSIRHSIVISSEDI